MENSNKNRKKLIVSIIGIMVLILFSVGMVYAFFAYSRIGSRNNVLSTADLTFSFEDSNWIWLENAYPMYVGAALTLETNGANKYFANDNDVDAGIAQFKITSGHPSGAIHYLVSLVKEDLTSITTSQNNKFTLDPSTKIEQLPDGAISLNLQTSTSDIFDTTGLVNDLNNLSFPGRSFEPSVSNSNYVNDVGEIKVSELPNGTETNEKVLGSGIMSGDVASRYFELRMWINDKVVINDELRSRCLSSTSQTDVNTYGRGYCNPSTEGMDEEITYVYSSGEFEKLYYSNRVKVQTTEVTSGVIEAPVSQITKAMLATDPPIVDNPAMYSEAPAAETTGLMLLKSTEGDAHPIYYYRGNVTNNHLLFANYCWRIVRTTDTGGIKLIYDGSPSNGTCNNTGTASQIEANKYYASTHDALDGIGYKYPIPNKTPHGIYRSSLEEYYGISNFVFGKYVNFTNGSYSLISTVTKTVDDMYDDIIDPNSSSSTWNYHYTCFNSTGVCPKVYYIYEFDRDQTFIYYELTNGEMYEDLMEEHYTNSNGEGETLAYRANNNWFNSHLNNYDDYIEDSVYCNDRSTDNLFGYLIDHSYFHSQVYFSSKSRLVDTNNPTLTCPRNIDKFTVGSSGNGQLANPIGLITADEVVMAGGIYGSSNVSNYLATGENIWTMTPYSMYGYNVVYWDVNANGNIKTHNLNGSTAGIRPVITLSVNVEKSGGDGSAEHPYTIEYGEN